MTYCDILIPGYYFCDLIFTEIPGFPTLGHELYTGSLNIVPGGCLNTVAALRRLNVDVGWVTVLGSDMFSAFAATWITRENIRPDWIEHIDQPIQRVTVALSYPQDRAFVTYMDAPPDLLARTLALVQTRACQHLHFTNLSVDPLVVDIMNVCRDAGIPVSMDCQHRPFTLATPLLIDVLRGANIFMPNADEAQRLTETDNIHAAAEILRQFVPLLIIKDGANGSHAWRDGEYIHAPALSVSPIDTTGAGDVFNAGFLAAWRRGLDLADCLKWGNIAGGLSTLGYGGAEPAPTLELLQTHL